jgi:hypothetical protein
VVAEIGRLRSFLLGIASLTLLGLGLAISVGLPIIGGSGTSVNRIHK